MYILKKGRNVLRSFAKEQNVLAFLYVLCKRMLRSLRSFTFFAKERCVLCILFCSFEKNGKEQNVLLGFISCQNSKKEQKRMLRSLKERKRTERSERKRTQCPTLDHTFALSLTKTNDSHEKPKS